MQDITLDEYQKVLYYSILGDKDAQLSLAVCYACGGGYFEQDFSRARFLLNKLLDSSYKNKKEVKDTLENLKELQNSQNELQELPLDSPLREFKAPFIEFRKTMIASDVIHITSEVTICYDDVDDIEEELLDSYEDILYNATGGDDDALYEWGEINLKRKNYSEAIQLFEFSAKRNNALACYQLALFYAQGQHVSKNIRKAITFCEKALGEVEYADQLYQSLQAELSKRNDSDSKYFGLTDDIEKMKNSNSLLDKIGYGISILGKSAINVVTAGASVIDEVNEQNRAAIEKRKK